ncbi:hypothetical protein HK104_010308 [Borealophlyctis nickersoniae]|nr:hypothetical protein HK104_010308 [Borealophlyctis nickersoniae]
MAALDSVFLQRSLQAAESELGEQKVIGCSFTMTAPSRVNFTSISPTLQLATMSSVRAGRLHRILQRATLPGFSLRPFASLAPDVNSLFLTPTNASPLKNLFDGVLSAVAKDNEVLETPEEVFKRKYAEKLRNKAESEGVSSVDELLKRKRSQPRPPPPPPPTPLGPKDGKNGAPGPQRVKATPAPRADGLPSHVKTLADIVDLEKFGKESAENISTLWNTYHSARECLSAVIPAETYRKLTARAKEFPLFILPLPRNEGYEFFLLQFSGHQTYFTPLLEYKTHRENARPHLVLTHYVDLMDSKNVVLMVGECGDGQPGSRSVLGLAEAQNLVYQMQLFYVTGSDEKRALVEVFHRDPANFAYQRLIDAVEKLG